MEGTEGSKWKRRNNRQHGVKGRQDGAEGGHSGYVERITEYRNGRKAKARKRKLGRLHGAVMDKQAEKECRKRVKGKARVCKWRQWEGEGRA